MAAQILATKLFAPRPRPGNIPRPGLVEQLWAGCAGKLTLISAPAGFGKTTLLAAWLANVERPGDDDAVPRSMFYALRPAWLSLDPADNDPVRFWVYVAAALDRALPGCAAATLRALQSLQPPAIEAILTELLNGLAELAEPLVLVLDDYHAIEAAEIHQALAFLVDHLPPSLRLVIATRVDPLLPLARLRARGELTELRIADLRFTAAESAAFLQTMAGRALSSADLAALEARTEGWAAGLQLAAIAMRGHVDPAAFIAGFTGSSRFVVDYLAAEVLDHLPSHLHDFVLRTAVLDRLCAPLCAAVLGADADRAVEMLRELERLNLFVIPLDDERHWFRYHHLFAEVLRGRLRAALAASEVARLHRQASAWYGRQVETEGQPFVTDAVQHALAATDWEAATRLLEEHGLAHALRGNVATVLGWLDTLPEALLRARPVLSMNHAVLLLFTNQLAASEARLDDVARALAPGADDEHGRMTRGQLILMRANLARAYGDVAACAALSREALAILPPGAAVPRAGSALNLARVYLVTGEVSPEPERMAAEAVQLQQRAGNQVALMNAFTNLAWLRVLQGRLRAAVETYEDGRAAVPGGLQGIGAPAYHFGMGTIAYEQGALDAAAHHLDQGLSLLARGTISTDALVAAQGHLAVARLRLAQGDHAGALLALDALRAVAPSERRAPVLAEWAAALEARIHLATGDLDGAALWADAAPYGRERGVFLYEFAQLTLAQVWIEQSRRDGSPDRAATAGALLAQLRAGAVAAGRWHSVMAISILQALALSVSGRQPGALDALSSVLGHAAAEGYVRVFVDAGEPLRAVLDALLQTLRARPDVPQAQVAHGERVLGAFSSREPTPARRGGAFLPGEPALPDGEPLTARELEVLRLIAEGSSNGEIAERLVIAVGTVKRHINSLFGKLRVTSRTQALKVARARHLI